MTIQQSFSHACPGCRRRVTLSGAAQLQAKRLGVSCVCRDCGFEWIILDQPDPQPTEVQPLSADAAPAFGSSLENVPSVFIVDDEEPVRSSLRCLLELAGFHTESHSSAENFLAEGKLPRPACILLDLHMPGMGGLGLQRQLQQVGCFIPVIMMSGDADVVDAVSALKNGAFDFFEKPCEPTEFVSRIHEAVEHDAMLCRPHTPLEENPLLHASRAEVPAEFAMAR